MPASLLQAKIRGVRSYSPYDHKTQIIDFLPLTLIVGSNGSGKTTIIESLKFIISGDEPPLSDCRRNFIHTSKQSNSAFDKNIPFACIDLHFNNYKGEVTHAKREIVKPISTGSKASTPGINSCYKIGAGSWKYINTQDDWNRTMPTLFSLPNRAILNYVILCHQEDNLWCMGDSSTVKQIFDKIFGCEQYKKEIKHIDAEIKSCKSELSIADRDLVHGKERVENVKSLKNQSAGLKQEIDNINSETKNLEETIKRIANEKNEIQVEISAFDKKQQELDLCRIRIIELEEREAAAKNIKHVNLNDAELELKMAEHTRFVDETKQQLKDLATQESALKRELEQIDAEKEKNQKSINKLEVINLKSRETKNSLIREFEILKRDYGIEGLSNEDFKSNMDLLAEYEYSLRQKKCDHSEAEESLASKQVKFNREINALEGQSQGLLETIKSKELFIKKLQEQLQQADPLSRDVRKIRHNLSKMQDITSNMSQSTHVDRLVDVINETEDIVKDVVKRVENESIKKINDQINCEAAEISEKKVQFSKAKQRKEELITEQKKIEDDLMVTRSSNKEAHNKLVSFSSKKSNISLSHQNYITEQFFLKKERLEDRQAEFKTLIDKYDEARARLLTTQAHNADLTKQFTSSFEIDEMYKANKTLRDIRKKIQEQKQAEAKLDEDLSQDDFTHQLKDKLKELEKEELGKRDRRSMLTGSKARIEGELYRIGLDLEKNKKVTHDYAENLGKVTCNKIILEDLEKLKDCFNHSLLTFHNQMIAKINLVLKSRWRQIYKGGDIQTIELVDEEITKAKGQKGYNYYISMTKSGIKMKMREKGSAGQKALACIIIRMALAELFVKDFGIIALDEPTANLDVENVKSLAKAIGNYVKRRAKRGFNIQWIIITHDEQFLNALDAESSPHYYRISLDTEGCSVIQKSHYEPSEQYEPKGDQKIKVSN